VHIGEQPGRPVVETISAGLRKRQLLLLLDNCEHLIAACADLADALLRSCPLLTILATSREGLNVPGEALMPVPALRVPDHDILPLDELREYEPAFALTKENAADIVRICRRLDGVPLALELAAARVRVLSVAQVAKRLDDRFRLLTGGSRTVLARQQTLRAMIDWSYDLLVDAERLLLRRLSIFVGGWSLEAAEAVCAGEGIGGEAILDLLAHLVDKSLVAMQERGSVARYGMLETIREYAREKLVDSGEADALHRRHFEHFFRDAVDKPMWARPIGRLSADYGLEYENFRAAIEWIEADPNGTEQALLLAGSLIGPAGVRGRVGELRQILTTMLARGDQDARTRGRGRALLAAASLAGNQRDLQVAVSLAREAVGIFRELGQKRELAYALLIVSVGALPDRGVSDRVMYESRALLEELGDLRGVAMLLYFLGEGALEHGDYDAARAKLTESLALFSQLGELRLRSAPLMSLGRLACVDGDYARARALVGEALAIRTRPDNPWQVAMTRVSLGEVSRCEGNAAGGAPLFEQSLVDGRAVADDMIVAWALHNLGHVALQSDDCSTAAARFRESLLLRWRSGPGIDVAASLAGIAGVALKQGELTKAVRLFGAVDRMLESRHWVLSPADERVRREDLAAIRVQLDAPAFDAAFRAGQAATFDELESMAR
jgi:non-specific serine/threonine protein kinase